MEISLMVYCTSEISKCNTGRYFFDTINSSLKNLGWNIFDILANNLCMRNCKIEGAKEPVFNWI